MLWTVEIYLQSGMKLKLPKKILYTEKSPKKFVKNR